MKAYKITDKNGECRGQKYEIGETYTFYRDIVLCRSGYHASRYPQDCLTYHDTSESRFFEVECGGTIIENEDKLVCSSITIVKEFSLREFVAECFFAITKPVEIPYGASAHSSTAGDSAHSSTAGDRAHSSTAGYRAHSSTAGESAHSSTAGYRAHSSTAGYRAHSSTAGYRAHSSTAGDRAHSSTAGDRAHSSTAGDRAVAASFGYGAKSKISSKHSWIVIVDWMDGEISRVVAKRPGQKIDGITIKTNHWYWFEDGVIHEEKADE